MKQKNDYLKDPSKDAAEAIIKGIDRDVERGEDIVMFGFCTVMLSSTFAPLAPPGIILPAVALTFAISSSLARVNYHNMEKKLFASIAQLQHDRQIIFRPLCGVFANHPMPSLTDSFNPIKNWQRSIKSLIGGLLINPLWIPIFYVMGMQIIEEKNLILLNKAVISIEKMLLKN